MSTLKNRLPSISLLSVKTASIYILCKINKIDKIDKKNKIIHLDIPEGLIEII